jgi:branched-chain amino acid transport system substrate-binding protein
MAQYAHQIGLENPLFAATWAQTAQLLEKGGQAVNGLELGAFFDPNSQTVPYQEFLQKFFERYQRSPLLGSTQAYETVQVLAYALGQTNGKAEGLPAAITAIKDFPALQGTISFDQYGDVNRDVYIVQVKDGKFVTIQTISSVVK